MDKSVKIANIIKGIAQVVVLVVTVICLCLTFQNAYYSFVYIDGDSMNPNLKNGEYGLVDKHSFAIDSLKRFDIVITYYPNPYDNGTKYDYCYVDGGSETKTNFLDPDHNVVLSKYANYKVKRVVALPGDQFTLQQDTITVRRKTSKNNWGEWIIYNLPYTHTGTIEKTNDEPITLEKDEYWVIGDNWEASTDSAALNQRIYRKNIQGVLVGIEGTCQVDKDGKAINKKKYPSIRYVKR